MKNLALVSVLLLPLADVAAQQVRSRPTSPPAAKAKQRRGGFHGIWFVEARHGGRPVLEVKSVLEGSDAERLGFREGDLIAAVNGTPVRDGDHFIKMLYMTLPSIRRRMRRGEEAEAEGNAITVLRRDGGRTEEVEIEGGLAELDATPAVGEPAPDFTLADADGENPVTLSELIGEKPVLLVFGSYT